MLLLLLLSLGLTGVVVARILALPVAKLLQAQLDCSDELVTDLSVTVPAGTFLVMILGSLIWISG